VERARRLRKGPEFDRVYSTGTVVAGSYFILRHSPNDGFPARWGFAVGKRLAKKAVVRNRIRRRLRECARSLPVRAGADIIVTARARALEATSADIRRALEKQLRAAGLLVEGRREAGST